MSAGAFIQSTYQTSADPTRFCKIRIQPETIALEIGGVDNDSAVAAVTELASALVGAGKRQIGVIARMATIVMAAPPTGYKADSPISLPVLLPATYAAWLLPGSTVGTYLGVACRLAGLSPERVR